MTGYPPTWTESEECPSCDGSGEGWDPWSECHRCAGAGWVDVDLAECDECGGASPAPLADTADGWLCLGCCMHLNDR